MQQGLGTLVAEKGTSLSGVILVLWLLLQGE